MMRATVKVTITQVYEVDIDVSEYSDDNSVEEQAQWLMRMNGNDKVLAELCRLNGEPYIETESSITIIKDK